MSDIRLSSALVKRARSDAAVAGLLPPKRVTRGWYKAREELPQVAFMLVGDESPASNARGDEEVEGSVQATITAHSLATCDEIAAELVRIFETDWIADDMHFAAVWISRIEDPGNEVQAVNLIFDVHRRPT